LTAATWLPARESTNGTWLARKIKDLESQNGLGRRVSLEDRESVT
jgi:hypothetical protein